MGLKYKIAEWIIEQRNRYNKGISETSLIKGVVELYILITVYVKVVLGSEVPISLMIGMFLAYFAGMWVFGYLWDLKGLFVIENEWGNKRNAFQLEVRKLFHLNGPGTKKDK